MGTWIWQGRDTLVGMSNLRVVPPPPVTITVGDPADELLSPEVAREVVLDRIDPETLRSAPLNLLLSTALAIAPPDALPQTEDAVLRQTEALTRSETALAAHARLAAENFVLANVEYQAAIAAYAAADAKTPARDEWHNPQHYFEALKVHERRMDRLLRARESAFARVSKASETYREAVLTRDGLEILRDVSRGAPTLRAAPQHASAGEAPVVIVVR